MCVRIHNKKTDEKHRALRILRSYHGHEIHAWGAWGFEDVAEEIAANRAVLVDGNAEPAECGRPEQTQVALGVLIDHSGGDGR